MNICSDRIKWLQTFPAVSLGELQTTSSINERYYRDSVLSLKHQRRYVVIPKL